MFQVDRCQDLDPNKPKKCESPEEIEKFFNNNIFYSIAQKTLVNQEVVKDNADPNYGTGRNYFPL